MISKKECLKILEIQIQKSANGTISISSLRDEVDVEMVKSILKQSSSEENAYIKLAQLLTIADTSFLNIGFREDCYDYLIQKGFNEKEAANLMEIIRKGKYRFEKYQISSDKLSKEFYDWAKGVKYLPSRKVLKDIFENKTIYKDVIVTEFND